MYRETARSARISSIELHPRHDLRARLDAVEGAGVDEQVRLFAFFHDLPALALILERAVALDGEEIVAERARRRPRRVVARDLVARERLGRRRELLRARRDRLDGDAIGAGAEHDR